jgi:hypothetical protein
MTENSGRIRARVTLQQHESRLWGNLDLGGKIKWGGRATMTVFLTVFSLSFLYTVQSKQALIYSVNVIAFDREAMFTAGTR